MTPNLRTGTVSAPVELPLRYQLRPGSDGARSELFVLLHGFGEDSSRILDPLLPILPPGAGAFAADAPFPVPRRSRQGEWKVGFSWYFWRSQDRSFYIGMDGALDLLERAIEIEGLADAPKRLIGFSQGGWLAPTVALRLKNVRQTIAIGCEFAMDRTAPPFPFRLDAVHGTRDQIVPIEGARRTHDAFVRAGAIGEFLEIPEGTHGFDAQMIEGVRRAMELKVST